MTVPEHLRRFPTGEAIASLAQRFNLPNTPGMQDWEYEVADPDRIDEFVAAYESGDLTEDECFTLMEIILQSFEESQEQLVDSVRWKNVLKILDENIELHAHSVFYWSALYYEEDYEDGFFRITPFVRKIKENHEKLFDGG